MLSRFIIVFLPRSKHLLISWVQSLSAVILEPKKVKSVTVSIFSPSICHVVMGLDAMILVFFECWVLSQLFHSPLSTSLRGSLVPSCLLPLGWYHLHIKKRRERQRRKGKIYPFECRVPKNTRREKKVFLGDQCKEIEENNRMGKTRDLFKKTRDTKRTFHAKMGSIKNRNSMDLTEAEDIKKRWQ